MFTGANELARRPVEDEGLAYVLEAALRDRGLVRSVRIRSALPTPQPAGLSLLEAPPMISGTPLPAMFPARPIRDPNRVPAWAASRGCCRPGDSIAVKGCASSASAITGKPQ
jgi:hypothetical protein